MTYRGKMCNGVVVLDHPEALPEGTEVWVEVLSAPTNSPDDDLLGMLRFAGDAGIADLATNVDHYLYGHPKVDDAD